jgi:hypothetical protein
VSNNRLEFTGLKELREALRRLPQELKAEAQKIVMTAATNAGGEIKAAYDTHTKTGNLSRGVQVRSSEASAFSAGAIVVSRAKHAWIFENGTQARHTDIGANRGAMPPGRVFIPVVMRRRRRMYYELIEIVEKQGLQVTGTP